MENENGNTKNIKWIVKGLNIHCYNCNDTVCFDKGYCQYKKIQLNNLFFSFDKT